MRNWTYETQACLRPCARDSLPVMGRYSLQDGTSSGGRGGKVANLYINSGHNCWGILWSAVSGLAIAEMVLYGEAKSVNLKAFAPERLF